MQDPGTKYSWPERSQPASFTLPSLDSDLLRLVRRLPQLERDRITSRIKQARVEAGLTQEEMADVLNVTQRAYQNYESIRVPWRHLQTIGEVTGKPREWFLRDEKDPDPAVRLEELSRRVDQILDVLERMEERLGELTAAQSVRPRKRAK